jgi:hypothetical protein
MFPRKSYQATTYLVCLKNTEITKLARVIITLCMKHTQSSIYRENYQSCFTFLYHDNKDNNMLCFEFEPQTKSKLLLFSKLYDYVC